MKFISRQ